MKVITLHDIENPNEKVILDAADFSVAVPFGSGSSIRLKSSDQPIAVHETPEEVWSAVVTAQ
jgi:hypothetical protein